MLLCLILYIFMLYDIDMDFMSNLLNHIYMGLSCRGIATALMESSYLGLSCIVVCIKIKFTSLIENRLLILIEIKEFVRDISHS